MEQLLDTGSERAATTPRLARPTERPFWALLIVVLGLLVGEAGSRLLLFGPDALLHPWRYVDRFLNESEMLDLRDGMLRLRPNLDVWYKGAHFTTNAYGLRGPSITKAKPAGVVRIAVMGRSNTMGHGVDDAEVWTRKLEQKLNAHNRPDRRFEVLNFAASGQNLPAMLDTYDRWASTFAPDIAMFEAYSSDFRRGPPFTLPKERPPGFTMQALLDHSWLRVLLVQHRRSRQLGLWGPAVIAGQRRPRTAGRTAGMAADAPAAAGAAAAPATDGAAPATDGVYFRLDRFIAQRRSERVATVLVSLTQPSTFERPMPEVRGRVARAVWLSRHHDSYWFSTDGWVLPRATLKNQLRIGDPHPDAFAHSLYAEAICMQLLPVLNGEI